MCTVETNPALYLTSKKFGIKDDNISRCKSNSKRFFIFFLIDRSRDFDEKNSPTISLIRSLIKNRDSLIWICQSFQTTDE